MLFQVYADKKRIGENCIWKCQKTIFFKRQSCFRASPFTKQFGWSVYRDKIGKGAIYGKETEKHLHFIGDIIKKIKAMQTSKK